MTTGYGFGANSIGAPYTGAIPLTNNTLAVPGRGIKLSCSADASVTLTLQDSSTLDVYPLAGATHPADNIYPCAVLKYVVNSGTIVSASNLV